MWSKFRILGLGFRVEYTPQIPGWGDIVVQKRLIYRDTTGFRFGV